MPVSISFTIERQLVDGNWWNHDLTCEADEVVPDRWSSLGEPGEVRGIHVFMEDGTRIDPADWLTDEEWDIIQDRLYKAVCDDVLSYDPCDYTREDWE